MSEEFLRWMLGACGVAVIGAVTWLSREVRVARTEMREDAKEAMAAHERRTDQFIELQGKSIESDGKIAACLEKLTDEVGNLQCNAGRFNSGGGR